MCVEEVLLCAGLLPLTTRDKGEWRVGMAGDGDMSGLAVENQRNNDKRFGDEVS